MLQLWDDVKQALFSLPSYFESELQVSGVLATDLFTFNSSLGATIEHQVVQQLNKLRSTWDPHEKYTRYQFERQPQRFPDVILRDLSAGATSKPLLGIELKGWYLLAKEREPSFRFLTTPAVCAELDLLVVFPWALSQVVSGSPMLFAPFVVGAKYAAEYRNWYWEHGMSSAGDKTIRRSTVMTSYPTKDQQISDHPAADAGGNFGRISRTGMMDDYRSALFDRRLLGIPLDAWQRFLKVFSEDDPRERVEKLAAQLMKERKAKVGAPDTVDFVAALKRVVEVMQGI